MALKRIGGGDSDQTIPLIMAIMEMRRQESADRQKNDANMAMLKMEQTKGEREHKFKIFAEASKISDPKERNDFLLQFGYGDPNFGSKTVKDDRPHATKFTGGVKKLVDDTFGEGSAELIFPGLGLVGGNNRNPVQDEPGLVVQQPYDALVQAIEGGANGEQLARTLSENPGRYGFDKNLNEQDFRSIISKIAGGYVPSEQQTPVEGALMSAPDLSRSGRLGPFNQQSYYGGMGEEEIAGLLR